MLATACDAPTWVVLRGKCVRGDGGQNVAAAECGQDAGGPVGSTGHACEKDFECSAGELCSKGTCTRCDQKAPPCPGCPVGSVLATASVNGCPLCTCSALPCKRHVDCPFGSICENSACVGCEGAKSAACPTSCPWSFAAMPFKRNGCAVCECAPPSHCNSDGECGTGLHCYRGAQCQDGCDALGCCAGNFCSLPGCEDPPALACDVVGCAEGNCRGDVGCSTGSCKCDGKAFVCSDDCPEPACTP